MSSDTTRRMAVASQSPLISAKLRPWSYLAVLPELAICQYLTPTFGGALSVPPDTEAPLLFNVQPSVVGSVSPTWLTTIAARPVGVDAPIVARTTTESTKILVCNIIFITPCSPSVATTLAVRLHKIKRSNLYFLRYKSPEVRNLAHCSTPGRGERIAVAEPGHQQSRRPRGDPGGGQLDHQPRESRRDGC